VLLASKKVRTYVSAVAPRAGSTLAYPLLTLG